MRPVLASLAVVLLLLCSVPTGAGPKDGGKSYTRDISASQPIDLRLDFKGGERATVIVKAAKLAIPADLAVEIRNLKGQVIARDDAGGAFAAVIWYPADDGIYQIKVTSKGADPIGCYVAVR